MIDSFFRYIEFEKRFSAHTITSYKTDLHQFSDFLSKQYETERPEEATFSMVRSWIAQLVESKTSARSVNRKISSLRSYFKFLLKQGAIQKDPLLKVKVLKTEKRLPTFIKEEEMKEILDADASFDDTLTAWREKLILELFYGSGIRLAELLQLKDSAIDLRARTLRVLGKRNKERVIPFSKNLVSIIEEYRMARNREVDKKQHGLLLVTDEGEPAYRMMVQRIVKRRLKETNAEKKSPHVLRHTYATHLLNKGAEINAVKDLLGHSSLAATQIYTHNTIEKLKKTFEDAHPKA
jgi:integrase/recombinase XerC